MPKLKVLSGSEIRAILETQGFVFDRQRGSHMVMQKETTAGTIMVAVPKHREVAIGTMNSIIRQSGLPRKLFEA